MSSSHLNTDVLDTDITAPHEAELMLSRRCFLRSAAAVPLAMAAPALADQPLLKAKRTVPIPESERRERAAASDRVKAIREQSRQTLDEAGFRFALSLPYLPEEATLRPIGDVARRLMALNAVFLWAAPAGAGVRDDTFGPYRQANRLDPFLTDEDRAILATDRATAVARHGAMIGWRLENMWPLAWIVGFDRQPPLRGMIDGDTISPLIGGLLEVFETSVEALVQNRTDGPDAKPLRSAPEVLAMTDLFYCAHNAVRSAQLDPDSGTVPDGFDPGPDGTIVHERRHAFTWSISPGIAWPDTNLST